MRAHQREASAIPREAPKAQHASTATLRVAVIKIPPPLLSATLAPRRRKMFPWGFQQKIIGKIPKKSRIFRKFPTGIPKEKFLDPKGPQGSAKGRNHIATGRDMVATGRTLGATVARPWRAKAHPSRQGRNLAANFSTSEKIHVLSYHLLRELLFCKKKFETLNLQKLKF